MVLKNKDMHAFDNYKTMKIIYSMYCNFRMSMEGFLSHRLCTDDDVSISEPPPSFIDRDTTGKLQ